MLARPLVALFRTTIFWSAFGVSAELDVNLAVTTTEVPVTTDVRPTRVGPSEQPVV
jgi:hypothetical protein